MDTIDSMSLISEADVERTLTLSACLEPVARALVDLHHGRASIQPRRRLQAGGTRFQYIGGWAESAGLLGIKFSAHPAAGRNRGTLIVFSADTGALIACLEARTLSGLRTAAATALATRHMARDDAAVAAIIGTGRIAPLQAQGLKLVRPIEEFRVYSRTPERRERFATDLAAACGVSAKSCDSVEEALKGADVVVTATNSTDPIIEGSWIAPGTHINAVGSNHPQHAELSSEALAVAEVVAVNSLVSSGEEAGDLIMPASRGELDWSAVVELGAIIAGSAEGRRTREGITVFKSVGIALEDVAVTPIILMALAITMPRMVGGDQERR